MVSRHQMMRNAVLPASARNENLAEKGRVSGSVSCTAVLSEKESLPELKILATFAMPGRLDSNQRPPEPHSLYLISPPIALLS